MRKRESLIWGMILTTQLLVACGRVERGAARGVRRAATRAVNERMAALLRRDLARDARVVPRALERPRTVFRYTTRAQSELDLRAGIRPGAHMTSTGGSGRPLGGAEAQRRYGLPKRPEVRETISLPKGLDVRKAKAIGGSPGAGELTSLTRIDARQIRGAIGTP